MKIIEDQFLLQHQDGGCGCGNHEASDSGCGCGHHEESHEGCGCGHHEEAHEGCGCGNHEGGCGHHHHEPQKLTLILEDNSELTCEILNYVKHNDKTFIVLQHPESKAFMIYEFLQQPDGSVGLDNIKDEEEFKQVQQMFLDYHQQKTA